MGRSHTLPRVTSAKNANQCDPRASADAGSARNDLPRAPCPQDILKVWPPNSLDYRARYDTPAQAEKYQGIVTFLEIQVVKIENPKRMLVVI